MLPTVCRPMVREDFVGMLPTVRCPMVREDFVHEDGGILRDASRKER